jgi:hypothetical protein
MIRQSPSEHPSKGGTQSPRYGPLGHLRLRALICAAILMPLLSRFAFGSLRPGGNSGPDPQRLIKQMRHAAWNEASGLSGVVYALAQTTDGFLWIGTTTGLYRFDGLKFEPFSEPRGAHPILDVHALLASPDGGFGSVTVMASPSSTRTRPLFIPSSKAYHMGAWIALRRHLTARSGLR